VRDRELAPPAAELREPVPDPLGEAVAAQRLELGRQLGDDAGEVRDRGDRGVRIAAQRRGDRVGRHDDELGVLGRAQLGARPRADGERHAEHARRHDRADHRAARDQLEPPRDDRDERGVAPREDALAPAHPPPRRPGGEPLDGGRRHRREQRRAHEQRGEGGGGHAASVASSPSATARHAPRSSPAKTRTRSGS
jgi:hypothetical protein